MCSAFGESAANLAPAARRLAASDDDLLVRTRAAEFLGLIGADDPRPTLYQCLAECDSGVAANLILNSVVLLRDGEPGYAIDPAEIRLRPQVAHVGEVRRRMAYLESKDGYPEQPRGGASPARPATTR